MISDLLLAQKYVNKAASSKSRGIPFLLSLAEYRSLITSTHCQYSGIEFSGKGNEPFARSLERINPKEGYTKKNTIIVCNFINGAKASLDVFMHSELSLDIKIKFLRKALYQAEKEKKVTAND